MDIASIVRKCFSFSPPYSIYHPCYSTVRPQTHLFSKYLEFNVPADWHDLELPSFVLNYANMANRELQDKELKFLMPLYVYGNSSVYNCYRTPYSLLKEVFNNSVYTENKFSELHPYGEDIILYAAQGAVFDSNFNPLFVCSWRYTNDGSGTMFKKPFMHMDPELFDKKYGKVGSFLTNKIFKWALNNELNWDRFYPIGIIIDEIPWKVQSPRKPDVTTTDSKLLQCVNDNIDELFL